MPDGDTISWGFPEYSDLYLAGISEGMSTKLLQERVDPVGKKGNEAFSFFEIINVIKFTVLKWLFIFINLYNYH